MPYCTSQLTSKVHIQVLEVYQWGERRFFQVKLPRDARWIVAVETTATPLEGFGEESEGMLMGSPYCGHIKLHGNGRGNICYAGRVEFTGSLAFDQLAVPSTLGEAPVFWQAGRKHGNQSLSWPVQSRVLFGLYEDNNTEDIARYRVKLYIHYTKEQAL